MRRVKKFAIAATWVVLVLVSSSGGASGQTYSHSGILYWSTNGHWYQSWHVQDYSTNYTFQDLEAFVATLSHQGFPGYLATYTSSAEFNAPIGTNSEKGFVGAIGDNTSTGYQWASGPDSENVVVYGTFQPETFPTCPPHNRLYIINSIWYGSRNDIGCRGNAGTGLNFTVEYGGFTGPVPVQGTTWGGIKSLYE